VEELFLVVADCHVDGIRVRAVGERRRTSWTLVLCEGAQLRAIRRRRARVTVADPRADEFLCECVGRGRESGGD